MGKYEDAIDCYNKVIEINSKYATAFQNKGISLTKLGRYNEAIECYSRAIELNPLDYDAIFNKGLFEFISSNLPPSFYYHNILSCP